jgi:hypothetical protein
MFQHENAEVSKAEVRSRIYQSNYGGHAQEIRVTSLTYIGGGLLITQNERLIPREVQKQERVFAP